METILERAVPLDNCGITILGPDGLLAQNLPGYEARQAQVDMANLVGKAINDKLQAMVEAGTGCIYGDAEVIVNRGGNARRFTLRELVEKFNGGTGPMGDRGGNYRWSSSIPTYVQREAPDGTVRLAMLKNAWCSGKKKTFIVTTETGRQIRATDEHPFLTERGWVKLGSLCIGDQVHCVAGQKTTGRQAKPRYRAIYKMHNHPHACRRKNGSAAVDHHRLVAEAALNGLTYEGFTAKVICGNTAGLRFINPSEYEVHHRDRDHTNNTPENLEVLGAGEHPRRHAEEGTYKHVLYKIAPEKVVSVKYYGEEMTYDLEVANDPHNFIVNGFVVHNTGKSFGYLIPAILSERRVVISTDTIALQQQLVDKDLPFLAKILQPVVGREIKFAIAKGRGNFFCLAGETEVITWNGTKRIEQLSGAKHLLIDQHRGWVECEVSEFGEQELYEIVLTRDGVGKTIRATAEHRWFTQRQNVNAKQQEKTTLELRPDDRLVWGGASPVTRIRMRPSPFGIAHGIAFGDGTVYSTSRSHGGILVLYGEKDELQRFFPGCHTEQRDSPAVVVYDLPNGFKTLPSLDEAPSYLYGWLAGYFAADGTVSQDGSVRLASADRANLEHVRTVCHRLGIAVHSITCEFRYGTKSEKTPLYNLAIDPKTINADFFLREKHRERFEAIAESKKQHKHGRRWKVVAVRPTGLKETVYCATVPTTHSFVLDGNILTGNCERNTRGMVEEGALLKDAGPWDGDLKRMAAGEALRVFQRNEWNGDKATLKLNITDANWAAISGEESCTGTSCQYSQHCPYMLAKQRWEQAEIVVTNHAMYLLHHYVSEKSGGAVGVLPEHGVWVADEAHTLPDRVCDVFGITLKHTAPGAFVRSIERSAKRLGIKLDNANPEQIRKCGDSFFESFHGAGKPEMRLDKFPPEILDLARHGMGLLVEQIKPIRLALYWATSDAANSGDEEKAKAIERLYSKADTLIEHLHTLMGEEEAPPAPVEDENGELMPAAVESPDDWVTYAEVQQRDRHQLPEVTLHRKPIETGPILRRILGRLNASVFTSATLATGEGYSAWKPVAADLGIYLSEALTLQVPAPFDYARQVHGYVPALMPEARSPEYHTVLAMEIDDILHRTQGRAFVLFTSYRDMGRVFDLVSARVRFPLMMQGEKPKDALLEDFLSTPNAVLFGTKTFWTGIDIPGERLTCVVIVKLPFPNHLHPLVEARTQRIEKRGGNSFRDFMLPRCIRDVQQGFGRLIRTKTDRGLFCVLDRRMRESRYGAQIANALPTFPCSGDIEDVPSF